MLKEILSEYDNSNNSLEKSLNKVISRWRHFLSLPKLNILPEDEIIGLIGELLLLEKFLINDSFFSKFLITPLNQYLELYHDPI